MKRLVKKIITKIGKNKARSLKKKRNSFLKEEYFICRVCKQVLPAEEMDVKDKSVCRECCRS
ncbi:hypothetical protein J4443_01530 [Candidatus Woesearchaeota archaeon]|nr:hypothetical protein [Candidatus Woesearchaeota archaeon]